MEKERNLLESLFLGETLVKCVSQWGHWASDLCTRSDVYSQKKLQVNTKFREMILTS